MPKRMMSPTSQAPDVVEMDLGEETGFRDSVNLPEGCGENNIDVSSSNTARSKAQKRKATDPLDDTEEDEDDADDEEEREDGVESEAKSNTSNKLTRVHWTGDEVEKFVDICLEKDVIENIDGSCGQLRHTQIFKDVAKALKSCNMSKPPKTHIHCSVKFRKLKEKYLKIKQLKGLGAEAEHNCNYFDKLSLLFGRRPRARSILGKWESDSSLTDEFEDSEQSSYSSDESTEHSSSSTSDGVEKLYKNRSKTGKSKVFREALRKYVNFLDKEDEKHRAWMSKKMAEEKEREQEMIQTMSSTILKGMESILAIIQSSPLFNTQHPAPNPMVVPPLQPFNNVQQAQGAGGIITSSSTPFHELSSAFNNVHPAPGGGSPSSSTPFHELTSASSLMEDASQHMSLLSNAAGTSPAKVSHMPAPTSQDAL